MIHRLRRWFRVKSPLDIQKEVLREPVAHEAIVVLAKANRLLAEFEAIERRDDGHR